MKKTIAVAGLGAAITLGSLVGAGTASAYPGADLDSQYVACVAVGGIYHNWGPSAVATVGHQIANDISSGLRDPLQERNWVYNVTPSSVDYTGANFMVNCATQIYLGFGPWSDGGSGGGSTLA